MNELQLHDAFEKYKPDIVIHFAARTDTLSNNIDDYVENTIGTENLLKAIRHCSLVQRVMITSTQYVYKCLEKPFLDHDEVYKPHNTYAKSKVIIEDYFAPTNVTIERFGLSHPCMKANVKETLVWI